MLPVFRMDAAPSPSPGPSEHSSILSDAPESSEAPHGRWLTDPPYTLPSGADHCPVPTCPSRGRKFKPYWRLNEHMKTKHGWPRRTIQPSTDRRLGNTFRADHHKKSTSGLVRELDVDDTTITTADDEDIEMPDAENDDSIMSRPRRSGAKKDYSRMFNDPYAAGIPAAKADKQSLLVTLKVRAPLTPRSKHRHSISTHSASTFPENPFEPMSPTNSKSAPVVPRKLDEIDETFITEAKAYLTELELGHIHFPVASTAVEIEASLRHLLASTTTPSTTSLRINTMLAPEHSSALRPIYHALAHRANSIASSSAGASPAPSTPQRRQSSMSSGTSISPPSHAGYGDLAMTHIAPAGPRRSSSNATTSFPHAPNFRPIAPRTSPPDAQHQLPLEHLTPAPPLLHSHATPPQPYAEAPATFTFSGPRTRPFEWEVEREKREGELIAKPKERVGERERRRVKERELEKQRERGRQVLGTGTPVVTPEVKKTGIRLVLKMTPGSAGGVGKGVERVVDEEAMDLGGDGVDVGGGGLDGVEGAVV